MRGGKSRIVVKTNPVAPRVTKYKLEVTDLGKEKNLQVVRSTEPQYVNFIHLWQGNGNESKNYIGYLRKDTGEFKMKLQNKALIEKNGIKEGMHFKVVPL